MKSTHAEMSALMEMLYDDTDKHHLEKFVQENGCLPDTSLLGIEPTMEFVDMKQIGEKFKSAGLVSDYCIDEEDGLILSSISGKFDELENAVKSAGYKYGVIRIRGRMKVDGYPKINITPDNMNMEATVTYGEELAPKNMNNFRLRETRQDLDHHYEDPTQIYEPPKNFANLDQISGLELQTFKGFRKLDDNIKMIFHSGSDYNCIGYIRCPETGIQLTKQWMPEASGRIERYDYYIKDSKGHGGKFELWFNPSRYYACESALVMESNNYGEVVSMQDIKRNVKFVEGEKGTMNSVYMLNGKQYRVRVETLVLRHLHGEPHIFFQKKDKPSSYGQMYKLPGGSIEPNKDFLEQAGAEVNEEILVKIKNIRYTGISYIKDYPADKQPIWQRMSVLYQKGVDYAGAITFVFVAEYDGPYKKYVHSIDRDTLATKGKWYPVKYFNQICEKEHKGVVYSTYIGSGEVSADATNEGFQPIEETSVIKKKLTKEDYSLMDSTQDKKMHRKVVSRHAMNGKNKVNIVSQENYTDWF